MGRKHNLNAWLTAIALGLAAALVSGIAAAQDDDTETAPTPLSVAAEPERPYPDGAYAFALGDFAAARDLFSEECEAGDTRSCLRASDAWRVGRGGPQDYDKAIEYGVIACDRGAADGCTVAATIHFEGRETGAPDYTSARELYGRACDLDDPRGCAGLGNMQYMGFGGLRDRREGIENLRQACRQDFEYACSQLDRYGQNR